MISFTELQNRVYWFFIATAVVRVQIDFVVTVWHKHFMGKKLNTYCIVNRLIFFLWQGDDDYGLRFQFLYFKCAQEIIHKVRSDKQVYKLYLYLERRKTDIYLSVYQDGGK